MSWSWSRSRCCPGLGLGAVQVLTSASLRVASHTRSDVCRTMIHTQFYLVLVHLVHLVHLCAEQIAKLDRAASNGFISKADVLVIEDLR